MRRRTFFVTLLGALAAPFAAKAIDRPRDRRVTHRWTQLSWNENFMTCTRCQAQVPIAKWSERRFYEPCQAVERIGMGIMSHPHETVQIQSDGEGWQLLVPKTPSNRDFFSEY